MPLKTQNTKPMISQLIKFYNPLNNKTMTLISPLRLVMLLALSLMSLSINAQNYNFTLEQNSGYNYTVSAVSLFDSGSFQPVTQSYGFVLVVPDGVTITVDSALPAGTNETVTAIPGTNVTAIDPSMADKDLFQIITDTSGGSLATHGNGETIPLVTVTINGNPTSGEIRLLSNTSTLASSPALTGALDAFFQVDVTDDSTVNFENEYNMLEGDESFSFSTLSVDTVTSPINDLSIFPNPAKDFISVNGNTEDLTLVEVFDINGKLLIRDTVNVERLDISQLQSAIYLLKLHTETSSKTIKFLKN